MRVTCREPGYLRLADPYDAGWTATVDGESAPVYCADHYLRAVFLESGEHEIVFRFDAPRVWLPYWIAAIGLLVAIWLVLVRRSYSRTE